ncbi:MAG: ABC transporter ATP-binding protein [Alphaproteobacteria bacterium]|nr:ABC transporter ATP-binding protein [Alphaproteobacteria bacterium]MCZ6764918.1 ABC transporter ATP-binding protein [Alphaproteobacteria bacterium]
MITVSDISKSFGGIVAVDGCSFEVQTGSITGLIGPNGAGKTTLFNIIAGFISPDRGTVSFDGRNITNTPPHLLFNQGLMRTFQIPHVFERMTVLENLMVVPKGQSGENILNSWFGWTRVCAEDRRIRQRALEVADFLNLGAVKTEPAGNLSGGQKKLLELGRTMMSDCKTVLLDEPGAGVNRSLMGDLVHDIERLNREFGYTFCVIEHDMDVIARLCDPVIVMAEGTVLTQGSFDEVRRNEAVLDAYLGGGTVEKS